MRALGMLVWAILGGVASAEEVWIPPKMLEPGWNVALGAAMPGYAIRDCGVINSFLSGEVITQCTLLGPDKHDVGYVTQAGEGSSVICGWGEPPEALFEDWVLEVVTGVISATTSASTCPAPVRWDIVCASEKSC